MSLLLLTGSESLPWSDLTRWAGAHNQNLELGSGNAHGLAKNLTEIQKIIEDSLAEDSQLDKEEHLQHARTALQKLDADSILVWAEPSLLRTLEFWKDTATTGNFVLLYTSPEHNLASHLETGRFDDTSVSAAISEWSMQSKHLLSFFYRHRDQSLLIDAESAMNDPLNLSREIERKFGLRLEGKPELSSERTGESTILTYVACNVLAREPDSHELYAEITSAADVIPEKEKTFPGLEEKTRELIGPVLHELAANRQNIQRLDEALQTSTDELSFNRLQIKHLREELDQYFNEAQQLRAMSETFSDYLAADPLLRLARKVRLSQP